MKFQCQMWYDIKEKGASPPKIQGEQVVSGLIYQKYNIRLYSNYAYLKLFETFQKVSKYQKYSFILNHPLGNIIQFSGDILIKKSITLSNENSFSWAFWTTQNFIIKYGEAFDSTWWFDDQF